MNSLRFLLQVLCVTVFLSMVSSVGFAQESSPNERWSDEVVELFSTLPVQDRGRIKPMNSIANLNLLTLNGKRTLKLNDDTKVDANRWLLDVLFFPELARTYPSFRVQNDEVIVLMGLEAKKKRDWYSYEELIPGVAKLDEEASRVFEIEGTDRTPAEAQALKLSQDLRQFENLTQLLFFSRVELPFDASPALREVFGPKQPGIGWMLPKVREFQQLLGQTPQSQSEDLEAAGNLLLELENSLQNVSGAMNLIPPAAKEDGTSDDTWWGPADILFNGFTTNRDIQVQTELLSLFETLEMQRNQPDQFLATLETFHARTVGLAEARGEYGHIPLEVKLYRWNLFTRALVVFLFAFILSCISFLVPTAGWLRVTVAVFNVLGLSMATTGIVMRCIIRSRPPIVSLYDTILFITCVVVLVALFIEWATRQRIGLLLAAFLGVAGMFLSMRYEVHEIATSGDTMASVVAVLDTNYYLAIHVTTVAMGYAGGLLASAIAHIWLLGRLFGFRRGDKAFYTSISRMVYGTVCFSLLFSLFGTIMGGVWANDSWGRFWGWDPKENGALLIVLWMLLILHARMGGYIRERGMANMAIVGGIVVSMSWWGVNLLNVGLHNYGFISGVAISLYIMWAVEAAVLALGTLGYFLEQSKKKGGGSAPPPIPPSTTASA
jgi:ABC-type transport system involved in cytochrome c biogenesis permease subunit